MLKKPWVVINLTILFCSVALVSFISTSYAQVSAPQNLKVTVDSNEATLSWDAPENGTPAQFFIYKAYASDTNADHTSLQFSKSDSTNLRFYTDDLSLTSKSAPVVFYYVTAVDSTGSESPKSGIVNAAPPK